MTTTLLSLLRIFLRVEHVTVELPRFMSLRLCSKLPVTRNCDNTLASMEASELPVERLKAIGQSIKDVVFGWIKEKQQKAFPNHSSTYYNIPFGINVMCLLYYSPSFEVGNYEIHGSDISSSSRVFKASYNLEFCPDGTIFGQRGKQLICGGWSSDNNSINFMLTWHGNCYQYNGHFDTILHEISGKWYIKNEKKRTNGTQFGTFKYKYRYIGELSQVEADLNNVNKIKLQSEYESLLEKYETLKKWTAQYMMQQDTEIMALKVLLMNQRNDIENYKNQIIQLTANLGDQEKDDNKDEMEPDSDESYKEWRWEEILSWTMSLSDGKYKKYEHVLTEKLQEEEVYGEHLCAVDKDDLHRFGITSYGDKLELMECIKELVNTRNF